MNIPFYTNFVFLLLTFFSLCLSTPGKVYGQELAKKPTLQKILRYEDQRVNPKIFAENARQLILINLSEGNVPKAAAIYDLLMEHESAQTQIPFMLEEDLLISILLGRYEQSLAIARYFKGVGDSRPHIELDTDLLWEEYNTALNLPAEDYFLRLQHLAKQQRALHMQQVVQKAWSIEDKEAFGLIYDYLIRNSAELWRNRPSTTVYRPVTAEAGGTTGLLEELAAQNRALTQRAASFLSDHPQNNYDGFIRHFIYAPQQLSDFGIGFDLSPLTGLFVFEGEDFLGSYFHDAKTITLGVDLTYKSFMLQLAHQKAHTWVRREIIVNRALWLPSERVNYNATTLDLAYRLRAGRFTLSPFIGLGVNNISHLNMEGIPELEDSRLTRQVAWQYGINLEFALRQVNMQAQFPSLTAPYLRLRGLMREPRLDARLTDLSGNIWSLNLSVGIYLRHSVARDRPRQ